VAAARSGTPPTVVALQRRDELRWSTDWPLLASGLGGLIVLSIDYTSAYQDALRGVVDWNEHQEAVFEASHPESAVNRPRRAFIERS